MKERKEYMVILNSKFADYETPDKISEEREVIEEIRNGSVLTDLQKTCITKRYFDDMKLRQIASELGITRSAVSGNIKRGINNLKKHFNT